MAEAIMEGGVGVCVCVCGGVRMKSPAESATRRLRRAARMGGVDGDVTVPKGDSGR